MSARFYVGQRVRVRWCNAHPQFSGATTTIVHAARECANWQEMWVGYGVDLHPDFWPAAEQLEPLTDPGRQVVSWEGSIWMPEHLREKAPESEGVKV